MPYEYIADAIDDAYIITRKAPEHVLANPRITYRWVRRIAYRRSSTESKRLQRFVRLDSIQYEIPSADTQTFIENSLTFEELIEELSPLLRETAELHFRQEYSIVEISEMLGEKPETIKKRCSRAKAELRRIWQEEA